VSAIGQQMRALVGRRSVVAVDEPVPVPVADSFPRSDDHATTVGVAPPVPIAAPAGPIPSTQPGDIHTEAQMPKNVDESLADAMTIKGAIGAALVDYTSGMTLGTAGGAGINLEVAAAGNTEVVRAKQAVMKQLNIKGGIEDILITLDKQLHLIRLMDTDRGEGLFIYLALNKDQANLAMARHQLSSIEKALAI
jgi:hypothetical protein